MDTHCNIKPWSHLFTSEFISGAEGEGDDQNAGSDSGDSKGGEGNDSKAGKDGAGSATSTAGDDNDDDDDDDEEQDKDTDTKGLKAALAAERKAAKASARALAKLQAEKDERELADKTEVEQAQIKLQKANEKAERLAAGLLTRDLNAAITKAAANFVDPTDAIDGVDRSAITFEQDPDDPADITIDVKSVEKEVKRLATKKPHFVKTGTTDGEPTGGKFGGKQQKQQTTEEAYKLKYPSL